MEFYLQTLAHVWKLTGLLEVKRQKNLPSCLSKVCLSVKIFVSRKEVAVSPRPLLSNVVQTQGIECWRIWGGGPLWLRHLICKHRHAQHKLAAQTHLKNVWAPSKYENWVYLFQKAVWQSWSEWKCAFVRDDELPQSWLLPRPWRGSEVWLQVPVHAKTEETLNSVASNRD